MEEKFNQIEEYLNSPDFLNRQQDAIDYVLNHVELVKQQLYYEKNREVIDNITFRIKSRNSIEKKLIHKQYPLSVESVKEKLHDVAGVRIVCAFLDDVYEIADRIRKDQGIDVVDERDYIKKPKTSGYQSLHLIVMVPVHGSEEKAKVEIQIRTVAMHFWANLDHQLTYKMKQTEEGNQLRRELRDHAFEISAIDKKMLNIRKRIEEIKNKEGKDENTQ